MSSSRGSSNPGIKAMSPALQADSFPSEPPVLQDGLVGSPCRPKDSEESSPTPVTFNYVNV